jgi:hypothetical protein
VKNQGKLRIPNHEKDRLDEWLRMQADHDNWTWLISWDNQNFFTVNFFGKCEEVMLMCNLVFPEAW